jgi:hypothetical protein
MKLSRQLEDVLNQIGQEVDSWPEWKRSIDPQAHRDSGFEQSVFSSDGTERSAENNEPRCIVRAAKA